MYKDNFMIMLLYLLSTKSRFVLKADNMNLIFNDSNIFNGLAIIYKRIEFSNAFQIFRTIETEMTTSYTYAPYDEPIARVLRPPCVATRGPILRNYPLMRLIPLTPSYFQKIMIEGKTKVHCSLPDQISQ